MRPRTASTSPASGFSIRMRGRALAVLLAFGATAWSGATRAQPDAADVAAGRELFNEGSKAAGAGEWEQARDLYQRAYELSDEPIALYSLGVAQKKTGQLVAALESFRAFLARRRSPKTETYVAPATSAVQELEGRVGRLEIRVVPEGIDGLVVEVNERPVPPAAMSVARLVDPGAVRVVARAPGHEPAEVEVEVAEGGTEAVTLSLEPLAEPPPTPALAPVVQEPPADTGGQQTTSSEPDLTVPVVLIGSGGALVVAGLIVGLIGVGEAADAPASEGPEADGALAKSVAGDILAGVGLVTAGVGGAWLVVALTESDGDAETASVWVRPSGMGVTAGGSF